MTNISLDLWQQFALAALVGMLAGLEREHSRQERDKVFFFAGVRTFPLISLLGCVLALMTDEVHNLLFVIGFVSLVAILLVAYYASTQRGDPGLTTELAALMMYLIGGLIYWDQIWLAVALGVLVTGLLVLRNTLHNLVARIDREDIFATLKFILISAVVLPLLPNEYFGPLNVFNPYQIWLMVVFVSAISFLGYIAIKLLGHAQGIWLTSLLGGLVSTTAVTLSYSERSRANPTIARQLAVGVVIASSTMYIRVLIEVFAFNASLFQHVWIKLVLLTLIGLIGGFFLWRASHPDKQKLTKFKNPFRLWPAIQFGVLFSLVLFLTAWLNQTLGNNGIYVASFISGMTKIDPITLSISQLAGQEISYEIASKSILLATSANMFAKVLLIITLSTSGLRRSALPILTSMVIISLGLAIL